MAKKFKLTKQDKATLLEWGYLKEDFAQIEQAGNVGEYTLCQDTKVSGKERKETPVDFNKAIELLGREPFLSGLSRSAFHWSAVREITEDENDYIYFYMGKLFE